MASLTQAPANPRLTTRYCLTEAVNGGAFNPCTLGGRETVATEAPTLANWLAARAYYWQQRGYTLMNTSVANQVMLFDLYTMEEVVVRIEEVQS